MHTIEWKIMQIKIVYQPLFLHHNFKFCSLLKLSKSDLIVTN